jgi:hypothetical protein
MLRRPGFRFYACRPKAYCLTPDAPAARMMTGSLPRRSENRSSRRAPTSGAQTHADSFTWSAPEKSAAVAKRCAERRGTLGRGRPAL